MKKYVLLYETAEDVLEKAPAHFGGHVARGNEFHAQGSLLMYWPFGDPRERSMAVSTSREAAVEFVENNPFVLNGVVRNWFIRAWDEAFVPVDGT